MNVAVAMDILMSEHRVCREDGDDRRLSRNRRRTREATTTPRRGLLIKRGPPSQSKNEC